MSAEEKSMLENSDRDLLQRIQYEWREYLRYSDEVSERVSGATGSILSVCRKLKRSLSAFAGEGGSAGQTFADRLELLSNRVLSFGSVCESFLKIENGIDGERERVREILAGLESIEMYSLNSMMISSRSGQEGASLSTISLRLSDLSRNGSEFAERFSQNLEHIVNGVSEFRRRLSLLRESSVEYNSLKSVLGGYPLQTAHEISRLCDEFLTYSESESLSDDGDLFRFAVIEIVEIFAELEDSSASGSLTQVEFLVLFRLSLSRAQLLLKKILVSDDAAERKRKVRNNELFHRFSVLRESIKRRLSNKEFSVSANPLHQFQKLSKVFRESQNELLRLSSSLVDEFEQLGLTCRTFEALARNFERIILLTRIEISRNLALQSALEGTLEDVGTLPRRLNTLAQQGGESARDTVVRLESACDQLSAESVLFTLILDECLRELNAAVFGGIVEGIEALFDAQGDFFAINDEENSFEWENIASVLEDLNRSISRFPEGDCEAVMGLLKARAGENEFTPHLQKLILTHGSGCAE